MTDAFDLSLSPNALHIGNAEGGNPVHAVNGSVLGGNRTDWVAAEARRTENDRQERMRMASLEAALRTGDPGRHTDASGVVAIAQAYLDFLKAKAND